MKHRYLVPILIFFITTMVPASAKVSGVWAEVFRTTVKFPCTLAGFLNESQGITVGWRGEAHYTTDGGINWPLAGFSTFFLDRSGLEILNRRIAWNCGNGSEIMITTDGGKYWYKISNYSVSSLFGTTGVYRYLSFYNVRTGWIASECKLGMTNDAGKNWFDVKLPSKLTGSIGAIALCSANEGFLLDRDHGGTLYRTKDAGQTWSSRQIGFKVQLFPVTPTPSAAMRFITNKRGIIIANCKTKQGNQIWSFTTSNGGKSWRQELIWNGIGNLFLTRDGKRLTICDSYNQITMLEYHTGNTLEK